MEALKKWVSTIRGGGEATQSLFWGLWGRSHLLRRLYGWRNLLSNTSGNENFAKHIEQNFEINSKSSPGVPRTPTCADNRGEFSQNDEKVRKLAKTVIIASKPIFHMF